MDSTNFPDTLEDAKRRVTRFAQTVAQTKARQNRKPSRDSEILAHMAHGSEKPSYSETPSGIQCSFCDKSGHSVQDCHSMRRWRAKNPKPQRSMTNRDNHRPPKSLEGSSVITSRRSRDDTASQQLPVQRRMLRRSPFCPPTFQRNPVGQVPTF